MAKTEVPKVPTLLIVPYFLGMNMINPLVCKNKDIIPI
jgi:hypothetical protein